MGKYKPLRRRARRCEKDRADAENPFRSEGRPRGRESCCVFIHQNFATEKAYHSSLSEIPMPESGMLMTTKFFPRSIGMAEFWPSC
jgi:hypothetical protein